MRRQQLHLNVYETNIKEIIDFPEFYEPQQFSIKDTLIKEESIYISYTDEAHPDCFNISIASAPLQSEKLEFSVIFSTPECVSTENLFGDFSAHQSGGRMVEYDDGRIFVSVGEFRDRSLAQDPKSPFGKILLVSLSTGKYEIISMGHRNVQGLYYDSELNVVLLTEHGPQGGDEINVISEIGGDIENFGWPIASYGEHYGFDNRDESAEIYRAFPLKKSHSDFGFLEPLLYFVPSIGISEIIRIDIGEHSSSNPAFMYGSLGWSDEDERQSLAIIEIDEDFRVVSRSHIALHDRVRDILRLPESDEFLVFLEGGSDLMGVASLLLLELKKD